MLKHPEEIASMDAAGYLRPESRAHQIYETMVGQAAYGILTTGFCAYVIYQATRDGLRSAVNRGVSHD